MRIRDKLLFGYGIITLVTTIVAVLSFQSTRALNSTFDQVSNETLPIIDNLHNLQNSGIFVFAVSNEIALILSNAKTRKTFPLLEEAYEELAIAQDLLHVELNAYVERLSARNHEDDANFIEHMTNSTQRLLFLLNKQLILVEEGAPHEDIVAKMEEVAAYEITFRFTAEAALAAEIQRYAKRSSAIRSEISRTQNIATVFGPLGIFAAIMVAISSMRLITRGLTAMKNASFALAAGHLDTRVPLMTKDELGDVARSFNNMALALKSKNSEINSTKTYYNEIIHSLVGLLFVTDNNNVITTTNFETLEILGYAEDEVIGKPITVFFEKTRDSIDAGAWSSSKIKHNSTKNLMTNLIAKDGTAIPALITASTLYNDHPHGTVYLGQTLASKGRGSE